MGFKVITKNVKVELTDYNSKEPKCKIVNSEYISNIPKKYDNPRYLEFSISLMGEQNPKSIDLFIDPSKIDESKIYRYDWIFGIACINKKFSNKKEDNLYWDWLKELNRDNALKGQIVIKLPEDNIQITEISAVLLTLQPSKNTSSIWENVTKNALNTGEQIDNRFKLASMFFSNYITSGSNSKKNWFIYRFLDSDTHSLAIEWNISKNTFEQFGPVLRGSLFLTFHGVPEKESSDIEIIFRPQISFATDDTLCGINPVGDDIKLIISSEIVK